MAVNFEWKVLAENEPKNQSLLLTQIEGVIPPIVLRLSEVSAISTTLRLISGYWAWLWISDFNVSLLKLQPSRTIISTLI